MFKLLTVFISCLVIHVSLEDQSYDDLIKDIFTSTPKDTGSNTGQGQSLNELIKDLDKNKNNDNQGNNHETLTQPQVTIILSEFLFKSNHCD